MPSDPTPPHPHPMRVLWVVQGLSIMVFISDNEASQHAVNLAVALARQEVDSVSCMPAPTKAALRMLRSSWLAALKASAPMSTQKSWWASLSPFPTVVARVAFEG